MNNMTHIARQNINISPLISNVQKVHDLILPYDTNRAFHEFVAIFNQSITNKKYDIAFSAWTGLADSCFYSLDRYDELHEWIVKANRLLKTASLPQDENISNAFIAAYFNTILFCNPKKKHLKIWYLHARQALNSCRVPEIRSLLVNHLLLAHIWQGEMHSARLLYKDFLGDSSLQAKEPLMFMMQKTMHSQISWLNCDKKACLKHVKAGIDYSKNNGVHIWDAQLTSQAVYACIADQDFVRAEHYLKQIEKVKNPHHLLDNAQYHFLKGWLFISLDQTESAYVHAKRAVELTKIAKVDFTEAVTRILLAQVYFKKRNIVKALHQLAIVQLIARRMGSKHLRYAGLLAQSWAMLKFGRKTLSELYLKKAFVIGAKENYLMTPSWPHKIMAKLCELALKKDIEPEYTKKLIYLHKIQPPFSSDTPKNWPWSIQVSLFGKFQLTIQGEEWRPKRKTQQQVITLLKLLACSNKGIHQEKVVDILWEDAEADLALQSLHTTLHRLRALLKSHDAIILHNGFLTTNPRLISSDFILFESDLNKTLLTPKAAKIAYKKLCYFYSKGLLLDESNSIWALGKKEGLTQKFTHYLHRYGVFMEKNHCLTDSIQAYQQMVLLDELSEMSHQNLIRLYLEIGLNAEAMQAYRQCKQVFKRRLNISPSRKTSQLISQL